MKPDPDTPHDVLQCELDRINKERADQGLPLLTTYPDPAPATKPADDPH